jgi:hypothetical protein
MRSESRSFTQSMGEIGSTTEGAVHFDLSAYTNVYRRTATFGHTPTSTDSRGITRKGLIEGRDDVYFRPLSDPKITTRFRIGREGGRWLGVDMFPAATTTEPLERDLLLIGRAAYKVELAERILAERLTPDPSTGDLVARCALKGANVELRFSPENDFLIRRATSELPDQLWTVEIEEFQRVGGIAFPKKVRLRFENAGRLESDQRVTYAAVRVNDGSKPLLSRLPAGTSVGGFYDNRVYSTDASGRPFYVMTKGGQAVRKNRVLGYLYVGSLALLLFVSAGVLSRSIRKRLSSR